MTHTLGTFADTEKLQPSIFTKIIGFLRAGAGILFDTKPNTSSKNQTSVSVTTPTNKTQQVVTIDDFSGNFTINKSGVVVSKPQAKTPAKIPQIDSKLLLAKEVTAENRRLAQQKSVTSKGLDALNLIARNEKRQQDLAIAILKEKNFETAIASAGLTEQELEDIKRLDERKAKSEGTIKFSKKRSGIDTVALKRIEEEKAATLLGLQNFSSTRDSQGRLKLFGKENFEFGGISKAEHEKRLAEEQARLGEVSKVTGLTRAQSNLLGEQTRQAQTQIKNIIEGKITQSSIEKIQKKLNVHGGLNEASIAALLARGVITGDDL